MTSTLDRVLGRAAVGRWLLALALGTGLVLMVDFIAHMGFYLGVLFSYDWWLFLAYYGCLLPGFIATWLPLSVLVSAMLTGAPMLREGTLMALSGAGIAPARTLRPFLALGLVTGVLAFALGDQVVPRLEPMSQKLQARMKARQKKIDPRFEIQARTVGWRDGGTMWTTAGALPEAGSFGMVAAFNDRPRRVVVAGSLHWTAEGWELVDVEVVDGDRRRNFDRCTPTALGLRLAFSREELAERLRPDAHRTSGELISGSPRYREVLCSRLAWSLLPLLCLLYGLPRFLRWEDRGRLALAGITATLVAAIPIAATGILNRLLASTAARPDLICIGAVGALLAIGWLRWRSMRL
jgi:lipopolysaccharide export LptBFGC system permease protein LptF